jgi:hypothetical protein
VVWRYERRDGKLPRSPPSSSSYFSIRKQGEETEMV